MTPSDDEDAATDEDAASAAADTATDDTGLPAEAVDEAERLTRLARAATDPNEAGAHRERRDDLLAAHGYVARVRSEDRDDALVLHPSNWLDDDGTVRIDRVDVTGAVEVPLSGSGDPDRWAETEAHNRAVAERVAADHGPAHGQNAHALADFLGNHYAKRIEDATPAELREFREEYYPRNVWPDDHQRAVVEESVDLARETAASLDG